MSDAVKTGEVPYGGPGSALTPVVEKVDHPAHYGGADNPFEVIKVLRAWLTPEEFRGFLKGNVHKYLARARLKGNAGEDAAKAAWYAKTLSEFEKSIG